MWAAGTPLAIQVENYWSMFGGSVGPQQGGTTMKISKLLSIDGYNAGLWDLSVSLRKQCFSRRDTWWTDEGRERPGLFSGASKPAQAHSLYVFQNEFHSQLECLVSAGSIAFYPLPTALVSTFPLNSSNSKAEGGTYISSLTLSLILSVFLKAALPK